MSTKYTKGKDLTIYALCGYDPPCPKTGQGTGQHNRALLTTKHTKNLKKI